MGQSRGPLQGKAPSWRRQYEASGHRCGRDETPRSGTTESQAWETRPVPRGKSRVINSRPSQGLQGRQKEEWNGNRRGTPVRRQGQIPLSAALLYLHVGSLKDSPMQGRGVALCQWHKEKAVTSARVLRTDNRSVHYPKVF